MNELFLQVVNISIAASWLVLAVLASRMLLQKSPKWIRILLWGMVAIRLVSPFSMESSWSLLPSAETFSDDMLYGSGVEIHTGLSPIDRRVNEYFEETYLKDIEKPAEENNHLFGIFTGIWGMGIFLMLGYSIVRYWKLCRSIETAVRCEKNIFQSENVKSPFVLGILRPRIYLPFSISEEEKVYVVAHEKAHISRKDHWWKAVGFMLLIIYWFQPMIWLAYILFCRDIELACDEKVIKELSHEKRADYAQTLVSNSVRHRMNAACPLAFGEIHVKERVKAVMNYKKTTVGIVAAVVVCVLLGVCFLTNPVRDYAGSEKDNLEQYRTEYIGDAAAVSKIAQNLSYPKGYSYSSIELQTDTEPYELIIFLKENGSAAPEEFEQCAINAFRLIGNMGRLTFSDAETKKTIASFERTVYEEKGKKFYITIGSEGVQTLTYSINESNGGCENADGSLLKKGEEIWLEFLDGYKDLRGVEISALDKNGDTVWTVSVADTEVNEGLTYLTADEWIIRDVE